MATYTAGQVRLEVIPDMSRFGAKLRAEARGINETVKVGVEVDATSLRGLQRQINGIRGNTVRVGVDVDSNPLDKLGALATGAAGKVALIGAAAGLAGAAIAVLPGLLAAAGGGVAVLGLSLKGVGEALKGYEADQDAAGKAAATAAKSTTASARAIRNANQAVDDARRQAGRTATQGAAQIAAAERRVVDAVQDEKRAQEDVTRARKAAALAAEDLRSRVSHLALDQEEATIRVQEAEEAYQQVTQLGGATERDKAKALLDLKQARLDQADLARDAGRAESELDSINKNGIDSTDGVQAALRRQAEAGQSVNEANAALRQTQLDVAQANEDAGRRVTEALRAVAEAQQDAAQSAAVASTSQSEFADAMAKLSPPAQELVRQLLAMKPLVDGLQSTAAGAFLPGLTQMLKDSETLFPIFNGFLREAGTIMGETARNFGALFKSSEFQTNLQGTLDAALPLLQAFGDSLVVLTDAWFKLGGASGPATQGLADFVELVSGGLADFLVALTPAMSAFGDIWRSLGVVIGELLRVLGPLIAAFSEALAPVLVALTPVFVKIIDIVGGTLTEVLIMLTPLITRIAEVFADVALKVGDLLLMALEAVLPLIPPLADALIRVLDALTPIIPILADFAAQVIKELVPFLPQLVDIFIRLIDEAILPLIPPLLELAKKLFPDLIQLVKWLAPVVIWLAEQLVDELAWGVENVVIPALDWLARNWHSLGDTWEWVWIHVIKPVVQFFEDRIRDFKDTFGRLTDAIGRKWAEIQDMFKKPINFVINEVWNNGVGGLWDKARGILPALPAFARATPFATGGSVYGPGTGTSDSIPALLSAGEHVWTAREVAKAGGHQVVEQMRAAALRGGVLPRFAAGGAVWQEQMKELHKRFPGLPLISGPRPGAITATGNKSMHSTGRAVDVPPRRDVFDYIKNTFGSNIFELIFSPMNGQQVYRGQPHMYGEPTRGDHWDHVHWSMQSLNGAGGGIGGFVQDVFNWFSDQARSLIDSAKSGMSKLLPASAGGVEEFPRAGMEALFSGASDLILGKASEADSSAGASGGGGSGGAEQWRGLVLQALGMLGQPASIADSVLRRMNQESGGNPRAINNWDSNAKRGTPSKGLMQVIDPTFRANRDSRAPNDIWNPLANVLASMRYAKSRYGSLPAAYNRAGGYDSGGWLPPGATMAVNKTGVPEAILTGRQWDSIQVLAANSARGGDGATIHVHPRESQDEQAIAVSVRRQIDFAGRTG